MAREPTVEELARKVRALEAEGLAARKAMQALRMEADRFREFAELLPEIVFEMDEQGWLTFVNHKSFEISGYSPGDVKNGFKAYDLLVPEDRERARRNMRRLFLGEEVGKTEYTAQRKDGTTFPVSARSTPIVRNGKLVGLRGFLIDTSEQKRTEEALRESEEKYRQLFLTESDAIVLLSTDTGEFIDMNDAALEMYGYTREECMKLKATDISAEPEHTWKAIQDYGAKGGRGKIPLRYHKKRDGTVFPVEFSTSTFMLRGRRVLCVAGRNISDRLRIEEELRGHQLELERLVKERTSELRKANRDLRQEITRRERIEEALRESEARYRALVEQMPAVTYTARLDEASTTVYISPQIEGHLGYSQRDYRGDPDLWRKTLHPEDQDRVLAKVKQARATGNPFTLEYRMIGRNGRTVWFRDDGRIVHGEGGEPLFLQGVMFDITAQKKIDAALQESEERFRTVFEGFLDGIILADPESGEILDVNPIAAEWIGMEREKIVGVSYLDFVAPESVEYAERLFGNVAREEAPGIPRVIPSKRADGSTILFETLGQLIQIEGQPVVLVVLRDVTERKRTENALRESEVRYRILFDGSPVALLEVNASSVRTYLDELRIRGIKDLAAYFEAHPEEALRRLGNVKVTDANQASLELFEADTKEKLFGGASRVAMKETYPHLQPELVSVAEGKTSSEVKDLSVRTYAGGKKHVVSRWSVIPGYERTFEKVLLSFMDITERKQMEQELQKIQKLESLGILAGGIAHDFNNVLTAIAANLSMARTYGGLREDIAEMLTEAETASFRAQNLTRQLLAFAKGGTPVKKTVSVSRLIRSTTAFSLSGSKVKCTFSLPEDLWLAELDEGQIGQVIQNLIINADQAMPRGGTIEIRAENVVIAEKEPLPLERGRYLKISIADQGIGISQKEMPNIFDPFFTTKQKGSGLGLTTAFAIVHHHRGHIEVRSTVEKGTTFTVYLPALGRTLEEKGRDTRKLIRGEGRILLVDDEKLVLRAAGEALTRMGYEVRLAEEGAAGIHLYKEAMESDRPFQAVIMDLTIPGGMGGSEAVGKILQLDPEAKIIASSGYSNDPVMSDFQEYGFCDVITKPYRIEELGELLARTLRGVKE